jgi:N6-adenosine-specific RNA methylase IME4
MAKAQHHLPHNVIRFPLAEIIQFPKTQLCGCGCGILLNIEEDSFIRCEETGQWYVDEFDFLKALEVTKRGDRYRFRDTDYWYTKSEFYNEMKAYWMNDYAPIA